MPRKNINLNKAPKHEKLPVLAAAIVCETYSHTCFLKKPNNSANPYQRFLLLAIWHSILVVCITRHTGGIAYAIWSAVGIVLISIVGYYGETLDLPAIIGIGCIMVVFLSLICFFQMEHSIKSVGLPTPCNK